jgi:hypothetical protein
MKKTIPADLRKAAKTMAREQGIPHQKALDLLARQTGHAGWGALLASRRLRLDPFRQLILDLWNAGGTDIHIEPWHVDGHVGEDLDDAEDEGPMTVRERHVLLGQLSTMTRANVPHLDALRTLRQHHGGRIAVAVARLEAGLSAGGDLAELMYEDGASFPGDTGFILRSGPSLPGGIAEALKRAARHQETLLALATRSPGDDLPIRRGAKILFRIHGRRRFISTLDPEAFDALQAAIVPCMTDWDEMRPADGTVSIEIEGVRHAFPVASFPANGSHKYVARIPDRHVQALPLESLGIHDLDAWMRICRSGPGIVIVSGKTSSGKSTTIAKTIERLRAEGIDAVAEEENSPFREERIAEMVETATRRTVLLEAFGSSLDRAIANAMAFGLGNGDLARLFRGGMHQALHPARTGPRTLETAIMPWG